MSKSTKVDTICTKNVSFCSVIKIFGFEKMKNFWNGKFGIVKSCFLQSPETSKKHTLRRKFREPNLDTQIFNNFRYFGHFSAFLVTFWSRPSPLIYFFYFKFKSFGFFQNFHFYVWEKARDSRCFYSKELKIAKNPSFFCRYVSQTFLVLCQKKMSKLLKNRLKCLPVKRPKTVFKPR